MNDTHVQSGRLGVAVTTLAAAFNLLVVIVICFVLMPRIDRAILAATASHRIIEDNNRLLLANQEHAKDHAIVIRRLNALLDAAAERAKKAQLAPPGK